MLIYSKLHLKLCDYVNIVHVTIVSFVLIMKAFCVQHIEIDLLLSSQKMLWQIIDCCN